MRLRTTFGVVAVGMWRTTFGVAVVGMTTFSAVAPKFGYRNITFELAFNMVTSNEN